MTFLAEESTTTRLSPAEIHALGLREVARIEEEMRAAARAAGFEADPGSTGATSRR